MKFHYLKYNFQFFFQGKILMLPLFVFLSPTAFSQNPCEKIYSPSEVDMLAEMPLNFKQFGEFTESKIIPVLSTEKERNGNLAASLRILFTISDLGNIISVEFPGLEASAETHRELANAFMQMGTWKPATVKEKTVCSEFSYKIGCIKWQ
ncbi:MAG TPA: hypothetical protein VD905_21030 [Flavobacteriales bacterium]|nr:hypothetical protein [Flavobacteriales bacterium]